MKKLSMIQKILGLPDRIEKLRDLILQIKESAKDQIELVERHAQNVIALRNKLQAYCILTGDLQNKPEGCLRDRVTRIEKHLGLEPLDVPEGSWLLPVKQENEA